MFHSNYYRSLAITFFTTTNTILENALCSPGIHNLSNSSIKYDD